MPLQFRFLHPIQLCGAYDSISQVAEDLPYLIDRILISSSVLGLGWPRQTNGLMLKAILIVTGASVGREANDELVRSSLGDQRQ
jgi:hypothetical protein